MKESARLLFLAIVMLAILFSAVYLNDDSTENDFKYEASFSYGNHN